ncbi:hypothetical protein RB653_002090 [Dictyostelium firmibasis]|uniref:Uncharacterized protein n=1 Tax=Dictyostelium firmibasis TaxID=79012 RepID=A0AAN7TVU7_9MYCE
MWCSKEKKENLKIYELMGKVFFEENNHKILKYLPVNQSDHHHLIRIIY